MPEQKENDAGDAPAAGKRSFSQRSSPPYTDGDYPDPDPSVLDWPRPSPVGVRSLQALVDPTDGGNNIELRLHVIDCSGYVQPASLRIAVRNDYLRLFRRLSNHFIRDLSNHFICDSVSVDPSSYQLAFLGRIPGTHYLDYVGCDQTARRFIDDVQNKPTADLWAFNIAYMPLQHAAQAVNRSEDFVAREQAARLEQSAACSGINPRIYVPRLGERYSL